MTNARGTNVDIGDIGENPGIAVIIPVDRK
jgi:hypothetical protein